MNYSDLYLSDLRKASDSVPNPEKLRGKRVFVTGAGGLIGSALVDLLSQANLECKIYAGGRNLSRLEKRFTQSGDVSCLRYDALEPFRCPEAFDLIIHAASPATPKSYSANPVETMLANLEGVRNLLEYVRLRPGARLCYISSSEVYGLRNSAEPYAEGDYGYLNILNPRACYPSAKRASETLCAAYLDEYGADSVIVRPGHVYGPTMTDADERAASQFLRAAVAGEPIVMKSDGAQLRSYTYVVDAASAILTVALHGQSGEAYNISNPDSIVTVRAFAERAALAGQCEIRFETPSERERRSYNLMSNSSLNSGKLEALGWRGRFDLREGVEHSVAILKENAAEKARFAQ